MQLSSPWRCTPLLGIVVVATTWGSVIGRSCPDKLCDDYMECLDSWPMARSQTLLQHQSEISMLAFPASEEVPAFRDSPYDAHKVLSLLFTLAKRKSLAKSVSIVSLIALVFFACLSAMAIFAGLQHLLRKGSDPEERRMLTAAIPSVASMMALDDAYFTPDLVVPDGCECILFLSAKPRRGQNYDVLDSSGGVVLRVADAEPTTSMLRRKLFSPGNVLLAQCLSGHGMQHGEVINFQLLNGNQECWATLRYETRNGGDDRCIIETRLNQTLFLFGTFQHGALNLTDSYGRLLATTGQTVGDRELRLRVAPLADVGLAMCGLMCLQAAAARS